MTTHVLRCLIPVLCGLALVGAAEPGDPGVEPVSARFLPDYPLMARWAAAGTTGGIPPPGPVRITVAPDQDLAAAIAGGGTVALAAGTFRLTSVVSIPSGTVLTGAGADATTIDLSGGGGLVISDASGVGLRGLRLTDSRAASELATRPPALGIYADREVAGLPRRHVALRISRARDCWLDRCAFDELPDAPLVIAGGERLTIRHLRIANVVQRGSGSGILLLRDLRDSLLHRLDVHGIRLVRISGDTTGNVIAGSAFTVPIHFVASSQVRDNLFEANLHVMLPGNPYPTFTWSSDPLGAGNLVVDSRTYAGGTDAIASGLLPPAGGVLAMASIPQRGTWNSETSDWRGTRFFAPAQRALAAAAAPVAAAPSVVLSPTPDPPAPAGPVVSLATATTVTTFLISSGPLGEAWDQLPGTAWPLADVPGLDAPLRVIPHTAQRDGAIDLLIAAGGDRRVLWLGCVIDAAVDSPVVPTIAAAVNVACYCSGQRIESGQAITLKAGRHPLWVVAAVQKPNPFTKRLPLRIGFAAAAAPSAAPPAIRTEPIPDPPGGTLYAASAPIDRQEIAAWPAILRVHHLLAAAEPDGLDTALAELAAMPSPTARRFGQACAAVIQEVEAAHQESDEILRWRLRSTAYFQAGLPQRSWAFEKLVKERWPGAPEAKPERIIP